LYQRRKGIHRERLVCRDVILREIGPWPFVDLIVATEGRLVDAPLCMPVFSDILWPVAGERDPGTIDRILQDLSQRKQHHRHDKP
jgi:hypothetical protein